MVSAEWGVEDTGFPSKRGAREGGLQFWLNNDNTRPYLIKMGENCNDLVSINVKNYDFRI